VVEVDRAAFRAAALPLHNDLASGAGWTKQHYDALQALEQHGRGRSALHNELA
jgi:hypothetical protein